jgi:hypothetical protein
MAAVLTSGAIVLMALALMAATTTATLHHSCAAVVPTTPPFVEATLRRRRCDETAEDAGRNLDVVVTFRFADANNNNLEVIVGGGRKLSWATMTPDRRLWR